jgi:hypothetical protein
MSNGQFDPTSIQAWRDKRTRLVDLPGGLAVKMRVFDPLILLSEGEKGIPNPLLAVVSGNTKPQGADPEAAGRAFMQDPQNLARLRAMLNDMLIRFVIAPPLVEQGHKDGISVDEITLDEKMIIFNEMAGGEERLNAATRFLEEPSASLVVAPAGETVQPATEPVVVAE